VNAPVETCDSVKAKAEPLRVLEDRLVLIQEKLKHKESVLVKVSVDSINR
jgi:hypothetical protein